MKNRQGIKIMKNRALTYVLFSAGAMAVTGCEPLPDSLREAKQKDYWVDAVSHCDDAHASAFFDVFHRHAVNSRLVVCDIKNDFNSGALFTWKTEQLKAALIDEDGDTTAKMHFSRDYHQFAKPIVETGQKGRDQTVLDITILKDTDRLAQPSENHFTLRMQSNMQTDGSYQNQQQSCILTR